MNIINVKRVGFLATGSELTTGEILNTNGQKMAQTLLEHGVEIGEHFIADDREENIYKGLNFLFQDHDAIIVSGGLGPTSDDRTRFAISRYITEDLVFIDTSWQRIVERLSKRNIPIPENNRQQALFPKTAVIFPNINGTADGCYLNIRGKLLFMLPGPPRECLPMFKDYVLPVLESHEFYSTKRLYRWRLMGVSESAIAEELEVIGKPYNLEFAYRAAYPYIEVKLFIENDFKLQAILSAVTAVVQPYLVTMQNASASKLLKEKLAHSNLCLSVRDLATKGKIAAELSTPETWQHIRISDNDLNEYSITITGLDEYWQNQASATSTTIEVQLNNNGQIIKASRQIYLRGSETMEYAIEFTSNEILKAWFA